MPDVSPIADHAASPSNIQHRRDRMRLLSPTPDDALWLPAVGQAQDFWRTLCIRYLNQQNPAYSQAEQCLANLADAVQKSTQPTRGQPSLTRKTSKNLALLPVFNRSLTHEQWAMLAFAQALRALLEQPSLDTRGKKSRSLEGEFMLRNVFARAFEGFKAQLAAGFLPSGPSEPASDDDWAQAQHQANQWLQHPEFLNETGWHQPEYFVRTLVEFIVAYSGLFEEVESDEPDDDDEDDEIDEEQETDNEGLLKNSDETTQDATGKKQPSDVATKTIRLSTQGRALLHGGIAAPRAMPDNHPMLVPPQPWRYSQRGGRLVGAAHLCKSKALNAPAADMLQLIERSDMPIVFQALNQLQNTAWRINQQVLRTSQAIYYGDVEKMAFRLPLSNCVTRLKKNHVLQKGTGPRELAPMSGYRKPGLPEIPATGTVAWATWKAEVLSTIPISSTTVAAFTLRQAGCRHRAMTWPKACWSLPTANPYRTKIPRQEGFSLSMALNSLPILVSRLRPWMPMPSGAAITARTSWPVLPIR